MKIATVLIRKPALFSFKECLWFLNRNYDDCLHEVTADHITKAIVIDGRVLVITLTEDGEHVIARVEAGDLAKGGEEGVGNYVRDWLDMSRDVAPFYKLLRAHKVLGYMAEEYMGLRMVSMPDVYEALCWGVIGQQINLTFAYKLKRRLVETYGTAVEVEGVRHYLFPKPSVLAGLTIGDLKSLQFSGQKAGYIIYISQQFVEGNVSKEQLLGMNTEERIKALTALKGVGVWTANYILMKALKDTSGIPHGDVGLLKALEKHSLITDRKDVEGIGKIFHQFREWESYLVFYLWRSLAVVG